MKKLLFAIIFVFSANIIFGQPISALKPVPSERQLKWEEMEFYLFAHFGPNTFTDLEWGKGTEKEEVFNPTQLDCGQWCRIAKAAGAKGIIITAKHHDGFCLWPSKYSTHTVAQSSWRNGKGDVLKELSEACKKYGLKMGIYLSPWDRNHPKYGTDEYNDVFINMMKEVVSRYGPFFEFWWDGANGEGPNGKKQVYEWHRFEETIRKIAPNTPVFSDIGPDIRWVGNENGIVGKTNWDLLDTAGFGRGAGSPPTDTLNSGNMNGANWLPAECDVSIRPGWFYHSNEDDKVKTPQQLFDTYLKSVGRGANLLLNVPPDRRGLINEHDSAALIGFKRLRDESFENNIFSKASLNYISKTDDPSIITLAVSDSPKLTVTLPKENKINCILLEEPVAYGQRISSFIIRLKNNSITTLEIHGTTIGHKRILTFPETKINSCEIIINESKSTPLLKSISAFLIPEQLIEK